MSNWITRNVACGFPVGMHNGHRTTFEPNVAVVEATGASVAYCHYCEDFALASEITDVTA